MDVRRIKTRGRYVANVYFVDWSNQKTQPNILSILYLQLMKEVSHRVTMPDDRGIERWFSIWTYSYDFSLFSILCVDHIDFTQYTLLSFTQYNTLTLDTHTYIYIYCLWFGVSVYIKCIEHYIFICLHHFMYIYIFSERRNEYVFGKYFYLQITRRDAKRMTANFMQKIGKRARRPNGALSERCVHTRFWVKWWWCWWGRGGLVVGRHWVMWSSVWYLSERGGLQ